MLTLELIGNWSQRCWDFRALSNFGQPGLYSNDKKWFCKLAANSLLLSSAIPSLYSQGCLRRTSLVLLDWQGRDENLGENSWVLQCCIHWFPDTILCCYLSGTLLMFNERKRTTQLEGSKSASWAPWSHWIMFPCLMLTLKNSMKVTHPTVPRLPEVFLGSRENLGLKSVSELVQETYASVASRCCRFGKWNIRGQRSCCSTRLSPEE